MKDQNKENNENVVVETAEKIPQESEPKKEFILIRAGKWVNRKYLQFKANPVGKWIVRSGKVTEGILAVYGLKKFIEKRSEEQEAVITCGEIMEEPETEPMEEELAEENNNECE